MPLPAFDGCWYSLAFLAYHLVFAPIFAWSSPLCLHFCLRRFVIGFRAHLGNTGGMVLSLTYICKDSFSNKITFTGSGGTYLFGGHPFVIQLITNIIQNLWRNWFLKVEGLQMHLAIHHCMFTLSIHSSFL